MDLDNPRELKTKLWLHRTPPEHLGNYVEQVNLLGDQQKNMFVADIFHSVVLFREVGKKTHFAQLDSATSPYTITIRESRIKEAVKNIIPTPVDRPRYSKISPHFEFLHKTDARWLGQECEHRRAGVLVV